MDTHNDHHKDTYLNQGTGVLYADSRSLTSGKPSKSQPNRYWFSVKRLSLCQ